MCPLYAYKHDPALYEMKILLLSAGKRMVDEIHSVADVVVYCFFFLSLGAQLSCTGCSKVRHTPVHVLKLQLLGNVHLCICTITTAHSRYVRTVFVIKNYSPSGAV